MGDGGPMPSAQLGAPGGRGEVPRTRPIEARRARVGALPGAGLL